MTIHLFVVFFYFKQMEEEVSSGYIGMDDNTNEIAHENDKVTELETNEDEPKVGMEFDSLDQLMAFYTSYAKKINGFAMAKKNL